MRELSRTQTIVMAAGALLMVIGVGCVVFGMIVPVATILFAIGAIAFASMQMMQVYEGNSIVVRRLRRTMIMGDLCFVIAALLMLESNFRILFPYVATTMEGYNNWVRVVHNNWVVALLIAAIIEMYTTHRISYELSKEEDE